MLVFLISCNDGNEYKTTVRGKAMNAGTGEPIEGVRVTLKDGVATSFFGVGGNTANDKRVETYTDENGEFEISLSGEFTAYFGAYKKGYYCTQVQGKRASCDEVVPFGEGVHENVFIKLHAESRFNPVFINSDAKPTDSLIIYVANSTSDYRVGGALLKKL